MRCSILRQIIIIIIVLGNPSLRDGTLRREKCRDSCGSRLRSSRLWRLQWSVWVANTIHMSYFKLWTYFFYFDFSLTVFIYKLRHACSCIAVMDDWNSAVRVVQLVEEGLLQIHHKLWFCRNWWFEHAYQIYNKLCSLYMYLCLTQPSFICSEAGSEFFQSTKNSIPEWLDCTE